MNNLFCASKVLTIMSTTEIDMSRPRVNSKVWVKKPLFDCSVLYN